jgi:DNA polymerase-3 subunit delta
LRFFLLNKDLAETDVASCYFLYGEETFLAQEFLSQLRELLLPPEAADTGLERFRLEETSWPEVIDVARTAPFLFSAWRVIALELPSGDKTENGERRRTEVFSERDENLVRDYLRAPAGRTVLVVILPGRANPSRRIVAFFSAFPESAVVVRELKPLRGASLMAWIDRKLTPVGKAMGSEAKSRLVDLVGNDLDRLDKELDKLSTFIGDKRTIDEEDVDAAAGATKEREGWELGSALETGDLRRALTVLANFFAEGKAPQLILGILSGFFREILAAQDGLRSGRDKSAIFRELRPYLRGGGPWLADRMGEFFSSVQGLSPQALTECLESLGRIDRRIKTSDASDATVRTEIEAFLIDFFRRRSPG